MSVEFSPFRRRFLAASAALAAGGLLARAEESGEEDAGDVFPLMPGRYSTASTAASAGDASRVSAARSPEPVRINAIAPPGDQPGLSTIS